MQREFIATLGWAQTALQEKDKRQYWEKWQKEVDLPSELWGKFSLLPDLSTVTCLPLLSFVLYIPFKLQKPYLSKDERDFHLLDNPVRKEKVFQTPMIASTSWKGALRAALWQLGYKQDHKTTIRLLGNPRESDEHQAGRLYFFPTFFEQIGLEVINPHDRKTGVGARGPILMECVPQETKGELVLLYVPFGPIGQDEHQKRAEVAEDLRMLAKGIQAMLTAYGFGAKTSSGFGTAKDRLAGEGKLALRAKLADEAAPCDAPPEPQPPDLPRYLESPTHLHPDLRREDGSLKSEEEYESFIESQGKRYGKKDKQLYDKAKRWWEREGRALAEAPPQESEPEPELLETPPVSKFPFCTLSELCQVAQQVAVQLQGGGEG
ncbi:MAG: hypothetical protein Kow0063_16010 [Anaerolineae bacterium]